MLPVDDVNGVVVQVMGEDPVAPLLAPACVRPFCAPGNPPHSPQLEPVFEGIPVTPCQWCGGMAAA